MESSIEDLKEFDPYFIDDETQDEMFKNFEEETNENYVWGIVDSENKIIGLFDKASRTQAEGICRSYQKVIKIALNRLFKG